jgi:hypothetical protein
MSKIDFAMAQSPDGSIQQCLTAPIPKMPALRRESRG